MLPPPRELIRTQPQPERRPRYGRHTNPQPQSRPPTCAHAVPRRRSDSESESSRRLKNELLVRMSDAAEGVLVLGATNLPWALDPAVPVAFLRLEPLTVALDLTAVS